VVTASNSPMRFDNLLDQCRAFPDEPSLKQVGQLLETANLDEGEVGQRQVADPSRPYGRQVLLATEKIEAMLATWTPRTWCAPHDHGGSVGGVRVLRGRARHRVFRITDGALKLVKEETVEAGDILRCGPSLVHQMRAEDDELVTLHVYAGPIDFMRVYEEGKTFIVDGGCGAWVPHDEPALLREVHAHIG
jgi:predicted metal-dependent enzyme (double-stranded beta helix superfamily)